MFSPPLRRLISRTLLYDSGVIGDVATRARHVHNLVAKVEESLAGQGLGEAVGHVVLGGHEGHTKLAVLDALAVDTRLK